MQKILTSSLLRIQSEPASSKVEQFWVKWGEICKLDVKLGNIRDSVKIIHSLGSSSQSYDRQGPLTQDSGIGPCHWLFLLQLLAISCVLFLTWYYTSTSNFLFWNCFQPKELSALSAPLRKIPLPQSLSFLEHSGGLLLGNFSPLLVFSLCMWVSGWRFFSESTGSPPVKKLVSPWEVSRHSSP